MRRGIIRTLSIAIAISLSSFALSASGATGIRHDRHAGKYSGSQMAPGRSPGEKMKQKSSRRGHHRDKANPSKGSKHGKVKAGKLVHHHSNVDGQPIERETDFG